MIPDGDASKEEEERSALVQKRYHLQGGKYSPAKKI